MSKPARIEQFADGRPRETPWGRSVSCHNLRCVTDFSSQILRIRVAR